MAKKRTLRLAHGKGDNGRLEEHRCAECGWSYDWHHPGVDGHMTLGRCPHYREGKVCVIAGQRACEHWKARP